MQNSDWKIPEAIMDFKILSIDDLLQVNKTTTIENKSFIEITKKTVRIGDKFEDTVYQFCNIAGFGIAKVKKISL